MPRKKKETKMVEQPEQTLTAFIKTLPREMSKENMFARAKRAGYTKTTLGSVDSIRRVLGIPSLSRSEAQKQAWAAGKRKHTARPATSSIPTEQASDSPTLAREDAAFLQAVNDVGLERATFLIGFIRSARAVKS